ncbi:hypothetical protein [Stenotrophomonas oahuensis]|uniref:Lipoprotein n=1 Tax=Stenotrophomonas oahuensis TaxID=3003271 RepID=A0ABY9YTF4_9GAMM|nr:hypothetical protein [Stenotrophomonas sp. A5586]WNH54249.1 hypothetical protein PDM29_08230 [Stenotrophomonas sp. A5586]
MMAADHQGNGTMRRTGVVLTVVMGLTACSNPGDVGDGEGLLKEFKYLGCEGDWEDESYAPEVLRNQEGDVTTYLVRHNYGCGYDRGLEPKARLSGETLKLDYRLETSGDGDMAACICEYRARFKIAAPAAQVRTVKVNGDEARLSDGEAFR